MTGTIELSDQDIQDLVGIIESAINWGATDGYSEEERARIDALKERLLKVEVNES